MKELKFETGLQEFRINGACTIAVNPTDTSFLSRYYDLIDKLDGLQDEKQAAYKEGMDNREVFRICLECDNKINAAIDSFFGAQVSENCFQGISPSAWANGAPLWMNLLLVIFDEISAQAEQQQAAHNPRMAKYLAKYKK